MQKTFLSLSTVFRNYDLLDELQKKFLDILQIEAVIGAEIEFYLSKNLNIESFISNSELLRVNSDIKFKDERGDRQFELEIGPSKNLGLYARQITILRQTIKDIAESKGGEAVFDSKPYRDDFGNSMHIHLNFVQSRGKNLNVDVNFLAQISCHYLRQTIDFFLPTKKDYDRLDHRFMSPTHICYGGNNRTVAIRIPDSYPRRIEHRLAGSNSDPSSVIYAILQSLFFGLTDPHSIKYYEKIYGNAFDIQYASKLEKIIP